MKNIEIDEELYHYIASNTQFIGESASSILRRLLAFETPLQSASPETENTLNVESNIDVTECIIVEENVEPIENDELVIKGSVFDHINKEELAMQRGAVGRFLLILAALYRVHGSSYSCVCEIRGRDRLYFAQSEEALAQSGSSTKPRQIPESSYWVITNSNTTRKKMMLTEVAVALGYCASDAEKIRDLL